VPELGDKWMNCLLIGTDDIELAGMTRLTPTPMISRLG
jgi:hypothetical protein